MTSNLPRFTFRIDNKTLEKLHYIADNNFRTVNKELEMIVKKYITDIENCYKTNFTIVLITNFSCTILEILLQKKILDSNSY